MEKTLNSKVNKHSFEPTDNQGHSMQCTKCGTDISFNTPKWDKEINGVCLISEKSN